MRNSGMACDPIVITLDFLFLCDSSLLLLFYSHGVVDEGYLIQAAVSTDAGKSPFCDPSS